MPPMADIMVRAVRRPGAILPMTQAGFTLLELMVVVTIMALLAVVAVPTFSRFMRTAKTAEAHEMLDLLKKGAAAYYSTPRVAAGTGAWVACQFPASAAKTPVGASCCSNKGKKKQDNNKDGQKDQSKTGLDADGDGRCDANPGAWNDPAWSALRFGLTDAHYYQYEFKSSGIRSTASFRAQAYGDLDCDGDLSTFELIGRGDPQASGNHCNEVTGSAIFRDNEIE